MCGYGAVPEIKWAPKQLKFQLGEAETKSSL